MSNKNSVKLIGHIGKDAECKHFDNGNGVANFTFATSESYKDKSGERVTQTEWHKCAMFRNFEVAEKFFRKGTHLLLVGSIKTRSYDDKNGEKRYITEIIIESFEFLGSKTNESGNNQAESVPDSEENENLPF